MKQSKNRSLLDKKTAYPHWVKGEIIDGKLVKQPYLRKDFKFDSEK